MASRCSEPPVELMALKLLLGVACSPTWSEPSLSDGVVFGLLARLPSIATLCSPLREGPALVGDHPCTSMELSKADGRRPAVEGPEDAVSLEGVLIQNMAI